MWIKADMRLRLVAAHLVVTLLALLALAGIFSVILENRVVAAHRADLQQETSQLAGQLDWALNHNVRPQRIQATIRRDSSLISQRIILLDRAGQVRYDSARWTPFARGAWTQEELDAIRHGRSAQLSLDGGVGVTVPLTVRGQTIGAVAAVLPAGSLAANWGEMVPALLTILGAVLLLWLLIGVHLSRVLIRPIQQVSAAMAVANLEGAPPVPERGWDEARDLARSYNDMVAEVARSRQTQRDFIANAAHELKTPVALIGGFVRSLVDGTAERGDAAEEALRYIYEESGRLTRIVEQLFALARLDADAGAISCSRCSPAELVAAVVARFQSCAAEVGIHLNLLSDISLPDCLWDEAHITSALANLITNALDHTPSGGSILVTARNLDDGVMLQVQDTGNGVDAADLPHVFDRFYRGVSGVRREGHAGLGLALVHEIVQRHGGTVEVWSAPGEGACFTLVLPAGISTRGQMTRPA